MSSTSSPSASHRIRGVQRLVALAVLLSVWTLYYVAPFLNINYSVSSTDGVVSSGMQNTDNARSLRDFSSQKGGWSLSSGLSWLNSNTQPALPSTKPRGLRVLFGIFTADFAQEEVYRKRHRDLIALWNDSRVCPLYLFQNLTAIEREESECEVIYTFVMGRMPHFSFDSDTASNGTAIANDSSAERSNEEHDLSTILVDESIRPLVLSARPILNAVGKDVNHPDTILLNIRENMDDGKSPSYLEYASQVASQYGIDYIVKCDTDSVISLHDFFRFAYANMVPYPYNTKSLYCIPWNKDHWGHLKTPQQEAYFDHHYNNVHLYCSGQLYIMSTDLAAAVGIEARRLNGTCPYCGHYEDHDTTTMAYHTTGSLDEIKEREDEYLRQHEEPRQISHLLPPIPIKLVMMGLQHVYWQHNVKQHDAAYNDIYARELARMAGNATFRGQRMYWTPRNTTKVWEIPPQGQMESSDT